MFEASEQAILARLQPSDLVLDVGGWACPFNRADWILDAEPYGTRGFYATVGLPGYQGGREERFSESTWVRRDICDKTPWPFADKQFDFSICSHTLEDVRDPLFVCSELIRVSKRGYIEVPSRLAESCRGWEPTGIAGLSHHRWLIDFGESHIQFTHKYHMINCVEDLAFPPEMWRHIPEEEKVSMLWWEDGFTFSETAIHGLDNQAAFLRDYVSKRYSYHANRPRLFGVPGYCARALAAVRRRVRLRSRLGLHR